MRVSASFPSNEGYRHEALVYRGIDDFVDRTAAFVGDGLEAGEAVMVMVEAAKIEALQDRLGGDHPSVSYRDMGRTGRNPARIIDAWQRFVDSHQQQGRTLRGIGEPVWGRRTPEEIDECQRHERLLNLALADDTPLWLLCPYDETTLHREVIAEAHRSHPSVTRDGVRSVSDWYAGPPDDSTIFTGVLTAGPPDSAVLPFGLETLGELRRFVSERAAAQGLAPHRVESLVLAVNEVATNSVKHGGGTGLLRFWGSGQALVCEVSDEGMFRGGPLAGRRRPAAGQFGGHGLWLANQLCDLVQVRSDGAGTRVRIRMDIPIPA